MKKAIVIYRNAEGRLGQELITIHQDAFGEGIFVKGCHGCSKTRATLEEALALYMPGRETLDITIQN